MPQLIPATLIPGDGIGPEIVAATLAALDALGAPFEWDRQIAGLEGVTSAGDVRVMPVTASVTEVVCPEAVPSDGRVGLVFEQAVVTANSASASTNGTT